MLKVRDFVQSSDVFHERFPEEPRFTGIIEEINESYKKGNDILPYKVWVASWGHHGLFSADELELL